MLGEKTYDTHVAWALAEAAEVEGPQAYLDAALANVTWAVRLQRENGWIAQCCLTDPARPLTHTLGYALRGVLEVYRISRDPALLEAGRKTADGILTALRPDGFLPGRLAPDWRGSVRWACLTGSAQIAHCWLLLYQYTADVRYREAAYSVNHFLRRTVRIDGPAGIRGGVKGSFPVDGGYGTFEYLNWAAKFFIDAQLLEDTVRNSEPMLGR